MRDQTRFWTAPAGELEAWACLQTPFWSVDFAVHPDASTSVAADVLAWVDERARAVAGTHLGRPMWFAFAFADDRLAIDALERAGFESRATASSPWSMVLMRHQPGPATASPEVPPGFTIRSLRGTSEVAAYVELHRLVFDSDA